MPYNHILLRRIKKIKKNKKRLISKSVNIILKEKYTQYNVQLVVGFGSKIISLRALRMKTMSR